MSIENLKTYDPFADAEADVDAVQLGGKKEDYVHIRIQREQPASPFTTSTRPSPKFDRKKILSVIRKKFACNGTVVADENMGEVIQLQGDQRKSMQEFLVGKQGLELDPKIIKIHGF
ncbi:translation initiation factor SUI1 [Apiospora kogelbergensis]|uniref:Translation initiation factor SUI1 n=1 Tax=Apiospora kogelbergensis TaxID=1337665 RepID=A0AAW0R3E5_9PEZI